ncbi:GNAT family N-acetyltransferase [Silvimonas sp.]|uniref:GNAT family N-acetyltransferase n=1 Tax=Silvimonas sp. TaxID=2650811 RepID=UPI0028470706|nr:GNAT family N-acetyltransferase [Silvimonas sp.]MDR3430003.1 GNAT family N-acetyltransferase [Silvimonas sp.]
MTRLATELRVFDQIADIQPDAWNRLAGTHPALQHAFLQALEQSGSVDVQAGWQPCHLTLWRDGQLVGAMPLYRKSHSWGEYVFDWAWARAYEQHGLDYYPKLISAVPFSPLPGARLLAENDEDRRALIEAAIGVTRELGDSSLHILFPTPTEAQFAGECGMQLREQIQFHWQRDPAWHSFDDFLASLNHDKRKKIKQERRKALHGPDGEIDVVRKHGTAITARDWAFFERCYANTYLEHNSQPYLNLAFFKQLHAAMPDACLLIIASRNGQPLAAAFDLVGPDALYGRYWGAQWDDAGFAPGLHFELCYYQGLEFALEHGLDTFEGGAQGEHKMARGFMPVTTWSAHWLADPRFANAVGRFLANERQAVDEWAEALAAQHPFRRT